MIGKTEIELDKIIDKLLEARNYKSQKSVNLTENEIKGLCTKAREIFIN